MTAENIRKKFIKYFSKRQHVVVDSSTLWPQEDSSVLLTTAGMQQFKSYFLGKRDPIPIFNSARLTSIQRCFRTSDIELVGDATHNTFFEMLGNFSIGDYFKDEAISLAWEFLTKKLNLKPEHLWATYFAGDKLAAEDSETRTLWQRYLPPERILGFSRRENWWGPPGAAGPCGPSSELYYDFSQQPCKKGENCRPNCDCGRFMELWNLVFMQYYQNEKGGFKDLPNKNIDTGMGLERLALVLQRKSSIFETDLFQPLLKKITNDPHFGLTSEREDIVRSRIVADHIKGSVFLLADGVTFSNKEQGYVLRRIFRRALDQYLHSAIEIQTLVDEIIKCYRGVYPYLAEQRADILRRMDAELAAYKKVLELDINELVQKLSKSGKKKKLSPPLGPASRRLTADEAFTLYATYGLSPERLKRQGFSFDEKLFAKKIVDHQSRSRAGAKSKFGGHGLDSQEWTDTQREQIKKYHTATHLLHQALREVLGDHVRQQGSDITPERLRFDFEHPSKLTDEEKEEVEAIVNQKIKENLPVNHEKMSYGDAINSGALAFFKEKYPEYVSVYSIGDYSRELCGGPHVVRTGVLGKFKITTEKSSSAGTRRIKAILK